MSCQVLSPDAAGIRRGAEIIRRGGVIAFPTETFYGLAADALNEDALERVFSIKQRERGNPLLLLIADRSWVPQVAADVSPPAVKLMEKFWPGPLTLVFKALSQIPKQVTGGTGKVGLRISSHPAAQSLVREAGRAVTATSANPSGEASLSQAGDVIRILGGRLDAVLDGGETAGGLASTVLDVSGPLPKVIREGAIPLERFALHLAK